MSMRIVVRAARRSGAITFTTGLALAGLYGGLPAAQAATARLHTTGTVYLSQGSNSLSRDFTEAPDGAVYYSRGSSVYVVKGTSAPKLVLRAQGNVLALAANSSELFADVGLTVTAYRLPSGTEVRHWTSGGREVHHLIDPATGEPAESGLLSVTVVAPDPAIAEVWSKVLFLGGREHIAATADGEELAAAWVAENGDLQTSSRLDPSVIWRAA